MTERDLAWFLRGHFELKGSSTLTKNQQSKIREKIELVMSQEDSIFAEHIEAVIDAPSSIVKLVDAYFKHEKTHRSNSLMGNSKDFFEPFREMFRGAR